MPLQSNSKLPGLSPLPHSILLVMTTLWQIYRCVPLRAFQNGFYQTIRSYSCFIIPSFCSLPRSLGASSTSVLQNVLKSFPSCKQRMLTWTKSIFSRGNSTSLMPWIRLPFNKSSLSDKCWRFLPLGKIPCLWRCKCWWGHDTLIHYWHTSPLAWKKAISYFIVDSHIPRNKEAKTDSSHDQGWWQAHKVYEMLPNPAPSDCNQVQRVMTQEENEQMLIWELLISPSKSLIWVKIWTRHHRAEISWFRHVQDMSLPVKNIFLESSCMIWVNKWSHAWSRHSQDM